jgi:hypothetical protein
MGLCFGNGNCSPNFDFLFLVASSVVSPKGETKEVKIKKCRVRGMEWVCALETEMVH